MISSFVAYGVYRLVLAPIAMFLLHLARPFLGGKIREMLREREKPNWTPLLTRPVWIHASSGEIEYAKSVIRELKNQYPELPVLVTYFSPSAKRLLKGTEADLVLPLPWDTPANADKFLNFYKPRAGLFARTDVWPTFATEAKKRDIPLLLFAATLSDDSSRLRGPGGWLTHWALRQLTAIFCVSKEDRANFERLSKRLPVAVAGDTRFDQVRHRLQAANNLPTTLAPAPGDFVFVAGSTWPEDEDVLLPAFKELRPEGMRLVLVPHEVTPGHLQDLEDRLRQGGLGVTRFSRAQSWNANEVLLVDQVGVLADLYRWGTAAFVGGSFKDKVHSVMEPLAAGLPVLVGPHHVNNREALQFQGIKLANGDTAVRMVNNSAELSAKLRQWKSAGPVKAELTGVVSGLSGASAHVVNWVEGELGLPHLGPPKSAPV